ncbi:lysoplasmalogenase [Catenulispora subtropica]|uniref:YhhN family protein n=1 Tax=Catenulispora subtropica TaxID=450798 RepID=A0ABN2QDZ4_9ACTN
MTITDLPPAARRAAAAYAVLSVANIVLSDAGLRVGDWITKPALMPLLAVFTWLAADTGARSLLRLPLAGILLGGAGDAALIGKGTWFLVGMGCFAAGHICYLIAFRRRGAFDAIGRPALAGYAAVWVLLLALTFSGLGSLLVPVVAYSLLLVGMAVAASGLSRTAAVGGALFLVSDGFIALGLAEVHLLPHQSVLVMPTYVAAQFLLALAWAGLAPARTARRAGDPVASFPAGAEKTSG